MDSQRSWQPCGLDDDDREDWGPATAIVAEKKSWTAGARIIFPVSDEAPRCGAGAEEEDKESIEHAVPFVCRNRVIVAPVIDWEQASLKALANELADGGAPGGVVVDKDDTSLPDEIADFVRSVCVLPAVDCHEPGQPGYGTIDLCDINDGTSPDCSGHENPCCVAHDGAGCLPPGDETIQNCVCQQPGASYCCNSGPWNGLCTFYAGECGAVCSTSGDGIPDECQYSPDCDNNGTPDAQDIANGTGDDCNANCILDACEIDEDCNANGVPDKCDIADGTSCDEDLDELPDECGACCEGGETCHHTTEDNCQGDFAQGLKCNEDCTCNVLSCCLGSECIYENKCACLDAGGYPHGESCGSTPDSCPSSDNPCCTGACCLATSCRPNTAPEHCYQGQTYLGAAQCDPNPCPSDPPPPPNPVSPGLSPYTGAWTTAPIKNRYLSLVTCGNPGEMTALRVELTDLPADLPAIYLQYEGEFRWVGEPHYVSDASGNAGPNPPPSFLVAEVCPEPYFRDWSSLCELDVYGDLIVPGADYNVQVVRRCADLNDERNYSPALTIETSKFGDVTRTCPEEQVPCVPPPLPPEGIVDFLDIQAVVDKFKNSPGSARKARCDLICGDFYHNAEPDRKVDFVDISTAVEAFRGKSYPPCALPGSPPCPDVEECP